jgi:phosphate transport system substrate-binding protein
VKLNRVGIAAGVLLTVTALAACSSSGSKKNNSNTGGGSSTSASTGASTSGGATNTSCAKGNLSANGSSAQANAMTTWATDYNKQCSGANVSYTSTNSGQGVSDFIAGKIGFGGSDAALDPTKGEPAQATKACGSTALDLPMVTGPIAIGYNLSGVKDLTLTPELLAKIFLGKITTWNDPAIAASNKGVNLPSTKISVFFRNDPSGTSKNFENYLKATAPDVFTFTPDKPWPGKTGSGVTGSPAVASGVKSTPGGIGYMEWSYAGNAGLGVAKIDNGGGPVALTAQTAGAAVQAAKITGTGDDLSLKLDYATKQAGAYPIILVTYEIVCTKYKDATTGQLVKSFLTYTSSQAAQDKLPSQGYAPLPSAILSKVQASVAKIS